MSTPVKLHRGNKMRITRGSIGYTWDISGIGGPKEVDFRPDLVGTHVIIIGSYTDLCGGLPRENPSYSVAACNGTGKMSWFQYPLQMELVDPGGEYFLLQALLLYDHLENDILDLEIIFLNWDYLCVHLPYKVIKFLAVKLELQNVLVFLNEWYWKGHHWMKYFACIDFAMDPITEKSVYMDIVMKNLPIAYWPAFSRLYDEVRHVMRNTTYSIQ